MYLQLSTPDSCYELKFESALNCIVGDSATGKTHLVECLKRYKYTTDASMVTTTLIPEMLLVLPTKSRVVLDIDDLSDSKLIDSISTCGRDDVCFVLLGRKNIKKLPLSVDNVFKFITSNQVTKNVKLVDFELCNINKFSTVITEDEKSGYLFFNKIFKTLPVCSNSRIVHNINEHNIVIFDKVGFGSYIEEFLDILKDKPYISYIGYSSFEGFILEEIFGITEIPIAINTEEALTKLLKFYKGGYSKSLGCTGDACARCKLLCEQEPKDLLRKSKYKDLFKYYKPSSDAYPKLCAYKEKFKFNNSDFVEELKRLMHLFKIDNLMDLEDKIDTLM